MAHEFESGMSVGEVPWHGLGKVLETPPQSVEEAIVMADLNWSVALCPLRATFEGETIESSSRSVIRTSDKTELGVVGPDYHVVQNIDAFRFFDPALEKGLATIETAGSLKNGRRVWMLAKVSGAEAEIVEGDPINGYFLLSNSHDGSMTVRAGFTAVRVVCNNTLTAALDGRLIRVRHTKNAAEALQELNQIVDWQKQQFSGTVEQMRKLAKLGVREDTLRKYVQRVFQPEVSKRVVCEEDEVKPLDRICAKVIPLFENGRGANLSRGTAWGAYNAVTEYLTWQAGRSVSTRLDSLWFGQNAKIAQRAYKEAFKLAAAA